MTLEIIATNLSDAKIAEKAGADRIELSPSMLELGITPSYGLIERVASEIKIPFHVIIRPHSQSFVYSEDDVKVMERDIEMVKKLGGNGVVFGPLTEEGTIDEEVLKRLLYVAEDLDVTIHKAFDFVRDQEEALYCLAKYPQIKRIGTSGGNQPAPEVPSVIKNLIRLAEGTSLEIMIAGGLLPSNFEKFYQEVRPKEVHFGSGVRVEENYLLPLDFEKIAYVKSILQKY